MRAISRGLIIFCICAGLPCWSAEIEPVQFQPALKAPEVRPAAAGAVVDICPLLQSGQATFALVTDGRDHPVPKVSVLVNGVPFDTDDYGVARLQVPNAGAVTINLKGSDGAEVDKHVFALIPHGLLVSNPDAAPFVQNIMSGRAKSKQPTLYFAPLVVQPKSGFVLLGANFSAKPDENRVSIDGNDCEVVSASPCCILAKAPARLTAGPVKEMIIAVKGNDSPDMAEVDVCTPLVNMPELRQGPVTGSIVGAGTNFPLMISVTNASPDVASLASGETGAAMPAHIHVITRGGDQNDVPLNLIAHRGGTPDIRLELTPDVFYPLEEITDRANELLRLRTNLTRAQLIRLKRRLIGVEQRILEERDKQNTPDLSAADAEKNSAALRALTVRQFAIARALASRQSMFQSLGASDSDFETAMDDAANGAYQTLERTVANLVIVPGAVTPTATTTVSVDPFKRRYSRLPVPRMKLLPPKELALTNPPAELLNVPTDISAGSTADSGTAPATPAPAAVKPAPKTPAAKPIPYGPAGEAAGHHAAKTLFPWNVTKESLTKYAAAGATTKVSSAPKKAEPAPVSTRRRSRKWQMSSRSSRTVRSHRRRRRR
jgi:hypothetical protein